MALLAVAVGAWCWARGRRADAVLAVGAMAGASLVFPCSKNILDRSRPPVPDRLVSVTNESLPSGHATMSIRRDGHDRGAGLGGAERTRRVALVVAAAVWIGAVGATPGLPGRALVLGRAGGLGGRRGVARAVRHGVAAVARPRTGVMSSSATHRRRRSG